MPIHATDGQTFESQSPDTQAAFRATYGGNADQEWAHQHNLAIGNAAAPAATPAPASPATGMTTGTDLAAMQWAVAQANQAAQNAYAQARLNLDTDTAAFQKGQQAWQNAFNVAQQQATERNQQNQTALGVLGLGAQLRGPQNYYQYLQTLGNTPQGLKDVVSALAGRYNLASTAGSTPGATYTPASVQGLVNDFTSGGASQGDGAAMGDAAAAAGGVLPSGNQWNAAQYQRIAANPTAAGLLKSLYEASGRDFDQEVANFKSSLPAYAYGGASGRVALPGVAA